MVQKMLQLYHHHGLGAAARAGTGTHSHGRDSIERPKFAQSSRGARARPLG